MAFLSVKGDIPLNHIAKLQHIGTRFVAGSCRPLPAANFFLKYFAKSEIMPIFAIVSRPSTASKKGICKDAFILAPWNVKEVYAKA